MNRLIPNIYGHQFASIRGLFDLRCGQIRHGGTHNSGWYNFKGEKIGWGDLGEEDMQTIKNGLQEGELFIVLPEKASFWNFVEQIAAFGSMCGVNEKEKHPGVAYMAEHANYVIAPGKIIQLNDYRRIGDGNDMSREDLLTFLTQQYEATLQGS